MRGARQPSRFTVILALGASVVVVAAGVTGALRGAVLVAAVAAAGAIAMVSGRQPRRGPTVSLPPLVEEASGPVVVKAPRAIELVLPPRGHSSAA